MVGSDLLRFQSDQLYIVCDFETCHLNLMDNNWPWQLAWVIGDNKRVLERHNHYINWGFPLPVSKGAAAATGFKQETVDRLGEDPAKVYELFNQYAADPRYRLVSHNWYGFDAYIKKFYEEQLGLRIDYSYLSRMIDTNCMARAIKMGFKPDRVNLKAWQYKVLDAWQRGVKTSLGVCLEEYSIPFDKGRLHAADYDVEKNWEVWRKQMHQIEV